jgi:Spy/CpxP family protein refolding chaperone
MGHMKGHGDHGSGSMHDRAHQRAMKFFKHMLKNKDAMSLTDEQVQQFRDLKINYKKDRIRMKADVDVAEVDLHVLLWNEKAKLADIEAQMNTVHGLMTKLHMASIKAKRDGKAVLTDEQRTRMDTMHKRMKSYGSSKGHPGASSKEKKCKKNKGRATDGHKK